MEARRPRRDQDAGHGSLGVEEPREAAAAGKAAATAAFGAGGEVAAERAHAAAWGGEKGPVGVSAPCQVDREVVDDGAEEEEEQEEKLCSSGGPQGPRRQLFAQELAEEGAAAGPQREEEKQYRTCRSNFSRLQLWELESVFQCTQYPDGLVRKNLAMNLNVSEAKVQVWFKNRRVKWRRHQRALMFRNLPPVTLGIMWNRPHNGILVQEPDWRWILPEPPSHGLPMPPMPPWPILPPPLPPLPCSSPHLPSFGITSLGLEWDPIINDNFVLPFL